MRSPAVPLAIYWFVALGLPVLDGAARRPGFGEHALQTIAVSLTLAAAWTLWRRRA